MRMLMWTVVLTVLGCVSAQEKEQREQADVSRRIDAICQLPAAERESALERLKKESGLVLYCGQTKD